MPSVPENLDGPSMRKMGTNASALLNNFMSSRPMIDAELKPLLEKLSSGGGGGGGGGKKKGPIVLLAVNAGVLDLVLNFVCSVRRLQAGGFGEQGDILKVTCLLSLKCPRCIVSNNAKKYIAYLQNVF
jgi:hypothetical protein